MEIVTQALSLWGNVRKAFSVYGGQSGVTLPFQAFLLVLIGFL